MKIEELIHLHPCFFEDLRIASDLLIDKRPIISAALRTYAEALKEYDDDLTPFEQDVYNVMATEFHPKDWNKEVRRVSAELLSLAKEQLRKDEVVSNPEKYGLQKEQKPVVTHGETYRVDTLGTQQVIAGKMPQKPAEWSEEDYHWEGLVQLLRDYQKTIDRDSNNMTYEDVERYICWVNSLRSQPKQEWSEEDEKLLNKVEALLDDYCDFLEDESSRFIPEVRETISRLKSLRPQYHGDVTMTEAYKMGLEAGKASSWKPSEEQMEAFEKAIPVCMGVVGRDEIAPLESLYEQLKKLM